MSDADSVLEPTSTADGLLSRRLLILANALRRAAGLRYRRLLDLRQNEWSIVAELGARAPRTLNDIATSLNLDKAQMSRSVATLVERGVVLRRPNPQDSREVLLQFSAKGRVCYAKLLAAGRDANRESAVVLLSYGAAGAGGAGGDAFATGNGIAADRTRCGSRGRERR